MDIKITVKDQRRDSAYCGGGCNGCSCSHCQGGYIPPKNHKKSSLKDEKSSKDSN